MKKYYLSLNVNDDFERGDCDNCPLIEYKDDFGEESCCEFNVSKDDCPLLIAIEESK